MKPNLYSDNAKYMIGKKKERGCFIYSTHSKWINPLNGPCSSINQCCAGTAKRIHPSWGSNRREEEQIQQPTHHGAVCEACVTRGGILPGCHILLTRTTTCQHVCHHRACLCSKANESCCCVKMPLIDPIRSKYILMWILLVRGWCVHISLHRRTAHMARFPQWRELA
jgi:hypothetical protein